MRGLNARWRQPRGNIGVRGVLDRANISADRFWRAQATELQGSDMISMPHTDLINGEIRRLQNMLL